MLAFAIRGLVEIFFVVDLLHAKLALGEYKTIGDNWGQLFYIAVNKTIGDNCSTLP